VQCKKQSIKQNDYRFSRKVIREFTGWGNTQLKIHCHRLEDMEYLLVHRGGRGQSFEYELLYTTVEQTDKHLMGLIDIDHLQNNNNYDANRSGVKQKKSGSSRPQVGGVSGASRGSENTDKASSNKVSSNKTKPDIKKPPLSKNNNTSYRTTAGMQEVEQRREQLPSDNPSFTAPSHPATPALAHPCASAADVEC